MLILSLPQAYIHALVEFVFSIRADLEIFCITLLTRQCIHWEFKLLFGLILTAPIHFRGSICEWVKYCKISPKLTQWRNKLINIMDILRIRKFRENFHFWVKYSFKYDHPVITLKIKRLLCIFNPILCNVKIAANIISGSFARITAFPSGNGRWSQVHRIVGFSTLCILYILAYLVRYPGVSW